MEQSKSKSVQDSPVYNIDELIVKAGGFGRYQMLIMMFLSVAYLGANFLNLNLAFMELVPKLMGQTGNFEYQQCSKHDVCNGDKVKPAGWFVDYSDHYSFKNWMTDAQLYCQNDFLLGLYGSGVFFGYILGFQTVGTRRLNGEKETVTNYCIIYTVSEEIPHDLFFGSGVIGLVEKELLTLDLPIRYYVHI